MSRIYHKGHLINNNGQASALCYKKPKAIPETETWTLAGTITCEKCLKIIKQQSEKNGRGE